MKHYLLLLACKDYQRNIIDIFNVDRINQWYLSNNEASRHSIYFKVARPNKY